jgi:hypothetical protein
LSANLINDKSLIDVIISRIHLSLFLRRQCSQILGIDKRTIPCPTIVENPLTSGKATPADVEKLAKVEGLLASEICMATSAEACRESMTIGAAPRGNGCRGLRTSGKPPQNWFSISSSNPQEGGKLSRKCAEISEGSNAIVDALNNPIISGCLLTRKKKSVSSFTAESQNQVELRNGSERCIFQLPRVVIAINFPLKTVKNEAQ